MKSASSVIEKDFRYRKKTQQKCLHLKSYLLPVVDSAAFFCSYASPTTEYLCAVEILYNSTMCCGAWREEDQYVEIINFGFFSTRVFNVPHFSCSLMPPPQWIVVANILNCAQYKWIGSYCMWSQIFIYNFLFIFEEQLWLFCIILKILILCRRPSLVR